MTINPPQSQLDTKRNQKESASTPGVKEQGEIAGASHANQGAWEAKEGKSLGPPKAGQVSKSTSETENDPNESTGNGAEVDGGP